MKQSYSLLIQHFSRPTFNAVETRLTQHTPIYRKSHKNNTDLTNMKYHWIRNARLHNVCITPQRSKHRWDPNRVWQTFLARPQSYYDWANNAWIVSHRNSHPALKQGERLFLRLIALLNGDKEITGRKFTKRILQATLDTYTQEPGFSKIQPWNRDLPFWKVERYFHLSRWMGGKGQRSKELAWNPTPFWNAADASCGRLDPMIL